MALGYPWLLAPHQGGANAGRGPLHLGAKMTKQRVEVLGEVRKLVCF